MRKREICNPASLITACLGLKLGGHTIKRNPSLKNLSETSFKNFENYTDFLDFCGKNNLDPNEGIEVLLNELNSLEGLEMHDDFN